MKNSIKYLFLLSILGIFIAGCSEKESSLEKTKRAIYITTTKASLKTFEDKESAIGSIRGIIDPTIATEISGKVIGLYARTGSIVKKGDLLAELEKKDYQFQLSLARAEVRKFQARLTNQEKNYQRNLSLVEQNFISENALDTIITEKNETIEELEISQSKRDIAQSNIEKTNIYAPISGTVEKQIPSIGDFLKIGDPIFQIISNKKLRAHIPFPEKLARKLKAGIPIKLKTPTSENEITVRIAELKPQLISDSRSIDIIADIEGQSEWQSGASVKGTVIFSTREGVAVPEQSVVLRPAGQVVYIVNGGKVEQRKVIIGINQDGVIEILSGLNENEVVALDGAAYLTDQTSINISTP